MDIESEHEDIWVKQAEGLAYCKAYEELLDLMDEFEEQPHPASTRYHVGTRRTKRNRYVGTCHLL